jgi:hypothetical protein
LRVPVTSDAFQNVSAGTTTSTGTEPPSIGTSVTVDVIDTAVATNTPPGKTSSWRI